MAVVFLSCLILRWHLPLNISFKIIQEMVFVIYFKLSFKQPEEENYKNYKNYRFFCLMIKSQMLFHIKMYDGNSHSILN